MKPECSRYLLYLSQRIPKSVRLIAISKGQSIQKIKEVLAKGQIAFGENYAQELIQKATALADAKIQWHFVGHLQKNKVAKVLPHITWLHSLDSLELAKTIDKKTSRPLKCLLEINLGKETTKSGMEPDQALQLIPQLKELPNIQLKGLMTIPPPSSNPEDSRPYFRQLFQLLNEINRGYLYPQPLTELSMGMSHDFEVAIEEGATMVRIGTAIFGERQK